MKGKQHTLWLLAALAAPIGSATLEALARDKENIVLIASDHTRPVPSKVIMPEMLRQIRQGVAKTRAFAVAG